MSHPTNIEENQVENEISNEVKIEIRNPYMPQHVYIAKIDKTKTIHDLKNLLFENYIEKPSIDSQRLIYRGRKLLNKEKINDIIEEVEHNTMPIFHLAVRNILKSKTNDNKLSTPVIKAMMSKTIIPTLPKKIDENKNATENKQEIKSLQVDHKNNDSIKMDTNNNNIDSKNETKEESTQISKIGNIDVSSYNLTDDQLAKLKLFYEQQLLNAKQKIINANNTQDMSSIKLDSKSLEVENKNYSNTSDVKINNNDDTTMQNQQQEANNVPPPPIPVNPPLEANNIEQKQNPPRRWRDYFNIKVAFNTALLIVLFGWDEKPEKFYMICAAACFLYLMRVGVITDIVSALKRCHRNRRNNENDNNNNDNNDIRRRRRNRQNLGLISIIERLIVGFVASIHPGWRAQQVLAAPEEQERPHLD